MSEIRGKLKDSQGNKYIGHHIEASFREKVMIENAETESIWMPSKCYVEVEEDGGFTLKLPHRDHIKAPVTITVLAPDGEVLACKEYEIEDLEEEIIIEADAKVFFKVVRGDLSLGKRIKITGRVLDAAGKQKISNKQVVLWGRLKGAEPDNFVAVLATRTDKQGYFFSDYPRGEYEEAYGVVGVGDNERIPIRLENGAFPKRVILVIEMPEIIPEEECPCRAEVPRTPDIEDFTNSPNTYSNDLGGGRCVDFTVPNRTLEEFSFYMIVRTTEPQIKGLTLAGPEKIPSHMCANLFGAKSKNPTNPPIDSNDPDDHGDNPLYPSVGASPPASKEIKPINPIVLKSLITHRDKCTPKTLMRAERLTLFLDFVNLLNIYAKRVPGRSRLTAENAVDWDSDLKFYQATTIAHGHLLHFKQIWKADGYSLGDLLYSLPLAPCQKKQIAVIDWDRREIAARTERLEEEERISAIVSRDRDIYEIANGALTERVKGGSISITAGQGGGAGGVYKAMVFGAAGGIGGAGSIAWQNSARRFAANSLQQLRDNTMQSAEAVRSQRSTVVQTVRQGETVRAQTEVVANYNHCHAITVQYFEVLRHFQVLQELVDVQECLFIPLLMSRFDHAKALRWREPLRMFLRNRALRRGFDAIERIQNKYEGSNLPEGRYSEETIEDLEGELRISFKLSRPEDKEDGDFEGTNWNLLIPFLWLNPREIFNEFLEGHSQRKRDRIFQRDIAPRIAEAFVQHLKFYLEDTSKIEVKLDPTLVSSYKPNIPLCVSLRLESDVPAVSREWIKKFRIEAKKDLPPYSKAIVHSGSVRYRTEHMSHFLFRDRHVLNDLRLGDPVVISTSLLDRKELRNPREEDKELANKLISHLNEHIEHYHKIIWLSMSKERRYMLLDGFLAPGTNGRSVASVVVNRLIGIVGNCLVMPVAPGFHLDPTYRQDAEDPVDLLHHYAPTTPIPPLRISVPTRGVFAEAVKGSCDSCEEIDDTHFWRWEESPCPDQPAPIQPLSTESRRAEPGDLTAKDFPAPMINLQNAPAAPDPTGLAAALQLLGTPNLFKDITGLEQTQKNALAALTASLDAAKSFGREAANLLKLKASKQDIGKTLRTIQQAEKSGLINKDEASKLTNSALRAIVGEERKDEKQLTDVPEVKDLLESTARSSKSEVSLTRPGESLYINASYATAASASGIVLNLTGSVGDTDKGADNHPDDVLAVKERLVGLGFDWIKADDTMDSDTIDVIKLFQAIVNGHRRVIPKPGKTLRGVDGLIEVNKKTHKWLKAPNAPRWQLMPIGSTDEGFKNYEREDTSETFDYGTDWMGRTIMGAGKTYADDYLSSHPSATLLAINDVSNPRGGDASPHEGHQTGLDCDIRLPRKDGTAGGIKYTDTSYDQNAMEAMLQALWDQDLVKRIRFNDPDLIAKGLCIETDDHDDHAHFEIKTPTRTDNVSVIV